MSKGSSPRPFSVKDDVWTERYCMTFGHAMKDGRCKNCGTTKPTDGKQEGVKA